MILHTASEGITLARKLENDSAKFYEDLAQRYTKDAETLLSFARDNKRYVAQIERAYYGVITDAIEGGYAFNMDSDDYALRTTISNDADRASLLRQALENEDKVVKFYSDAARQSESLLADVTRAFKMVAERRAARRPKLASLLGQ
jgi:rubrerythrin